MRACAAAGDLLAVRGLAFSVTGALVRDLGRQRRCPRVSRVTTNPEAFLRGQYDLVIEALGGVEPARTLVARLLGRGVPVVSANKSLLAAHSQHLAALAQRRGTALRYEASVLAGVPFLGTFARRPLAAAVTSISAILNGTSHFILTAMDGEQQSFADALARAQALGFAEPDSTKDTRGIDAAEKLALLLDLFHAPHVPLSRLEVTGIEGLTPADLAQARHFGGRLKPVVHASWSRPPAHAEGRDAVRAFVGPAFVSEAHPLANLRGRLNGICLDGRFVEDLFYSGPGAGPDITAATLLDDAVEVVEGAEVAGTVASETDAVIAPSPHRPSPAEVHALSPDTPWFVRFSFPRRAPGETDLCEILGAHGIWVRRMSEPLPGSPTYLVSHRSARAQLDAGLAAVSAATGAETHAVRVLEG